MKGEVINLQLPVTAESTVTEDEKKARIEEMATDAVEVKVRYDILADELGIPEAFPLLPSEELYQVCFAIRKHCDEVFSEFLPRGVSEQYGVPPDLRTVDDILATEEESEEALAARWDLFREACFKFLKQHDLLKRTNTEDLKACFVVANASGLSPRRAIDTFLRPGVQISSIGDWEIPSDALIPWQQWVELCGLERVAKHLLPTVSRLRGNESGFPKKYQPLWNDVRGAYLSRLQSQFPLSTVPEQIHRLEAMYNQLETAFYRSQENPGEMARLSNAMLKVLSAIHVLTGR